MKRILFVAVFFAALACGGSEQPSKQDDPAVNPDPVVNPDTPADTPSVVVPDFAKGADIGWASEMEAGGRTFRKKDGTAAPLLDVLKDCGINAIRLRVWVDPYKGWCGKADVLAQAKKVSAAGMALMIDFHYSDFFADPGRQTIPAAWAADKADVDKMCAHVSAHTAEVLQALKEAGVAVSWVQIGNETRNGMLFGCGDAVWKNDQIDLGSFVRLYNAGYDAAKAVYPGASVMPHLDNAYLSASYGNPMWLQDFKAKGGKFDMIAFSHYPQVQGKMWVDGKEKSFTPAQMNQEAVSYIRSVIAGFGVPVVVAEVGVKTPSDEAGAKAVLQEFMTAIRQVDGVAGVFYWEPEVDGSWKPAVYSDPAAIQRYTGKAETWGAYGMGAFTSEGKPTSVMDVFAD